MKDIVVIPYSEEKHRAIITEWTVDLQDIERSVLWTRCPGKDMAEKYVAQTLKEVADTHGEIFVAEIDRKPVGWICYLPEYGKDIILTEEANTYGYITDVYVAANYRGTGVYQLLLDTVIKRLKSIGMKSLKLHVVANNERALKAYLKTGFEPEEIILRKKI